MIPRPERAEPPGHRPTRLPTEDLARQARDVLENAVDAHRKGLKVYESLRNLNEVVGTEYGDRVLYELIQNAHDAHRGDDRGHIELRLVVRSETDATLYVANGGNGFRPADVDAIKNLATTAKEIGEGIGNKGLGFRSIEALTDDVRIFSRRGRNKSGSFDGYCFRFATEGEIEGLLCENHVGPAVARVIAGKVPRYLVPLPLNEQADEIAGYARRGYATVIVAPLRTTEAIELAKDQIQTLTGLDVPLLLFLDRIAEFRIEVAVPGEPIKRRRLTRRQTDIGEVPGVPGCRLLEVRVGQDRRFLVVQREVDKARVLEAVERSVPRAPQIQRWLDWKGQATVSVAVGLSSGAVTTGRFYNFLPMGEAAEAPLLGHLDAPFFAEIDRRDTNFNLPLNAALVEAAAEACAHAAMHIAGEDDTPIPQRAVFDLVAWTGEHAEVLDAAFEDMDMDTSLENAPVVPAIPVDGTRWSSLSEVRAWPAVRFSLMKATEVARRTGARLVSTDIEGERLHRLEDTADRHYVDLSPEGECLAQWSERFAQSLADREVAPRTWSWFYEDLNRVFGAAGEDLGALAGKAVMFDRSKKLRPAGKRGTTSGGGIFVRKEPSSRRRAKDSVPMPPQTLARRYRFLDEKITLSQETLSAFVKAGLVHEYDPVEALAGLGSVLGTKANANRRREALTWAFKVWQTSGSDIDEALLGAALWVPTVSGWRPATQAAFSSSWTPTGRTLENFLVEAAEISADCRRAQDRLLAKHAGWPTAAGETKRQWANFLALLGVVDGLRPVEAPLRKDGYGYEWKFVARRENAKEGFDQDWCREASAKSVRNPNTHYQRRGEAWRLPGQIEHAELPDTAKDTFHELAFRHLEEHRGKYLTFQIGRFERYQGNWNLQRLPTPLATFLRSKAWIAAGADGEARFRKAGECWSARTRQNRPPRFIPRVTDLVAGLLEDSQELADVTFGDAIGLRDWHSEDTATERLRELAIVCPTLAMHDRREFRREYCRAWVEVSKSAAWLPRDLGLAVTRHGRLERLSGDARTPPTVIVAQNGQASEARILSDAGYALLDVGEAPSKRVTDRLAVAGGFKPRRLDGTDVSFLVDDEPFVPSASDPLLTSLGLEWLPEVVILGHELLTEGLERSIRRTTIERRVQAIRVRCCQTVALVVDGTDTATHNSVAPYCLPHPELPTLILPDRIGLAWSTLGRDLSVPVSQLIHPQMRFLEPLLLRLAMDQAADALDPPSDLSLAEALRCDAQTLQELRAAIRMDLRHVLHLLMPVVAYIADAALARKLQSDAEQARAAFDVEEWLRTWLPNPKPPPEELVEACGKASDRATLRRELGLNYEQFNRALQSLGEPPLSNEAELRSVYDAYLQHMRPGIVERLRRHHAADFREGRDLATYVDRKTLAFLKFDPTWIWTREALDETTVEAHVARLLDDVLGEESAADLPSLRGLADRNRRATRGFADRASPVVGAWCRRNQVSVPEPWGNDDPLSVTRQLQEAGLLDFEPVRDEQFPELCHRAGCWPEGMPQTLDPATLGLDRATVKNEERRREQERQQAVIKKRSINFAGTDLDTGDPAFAETFRQLAENSIDNDDGWFDRSRQQPRLAPVAASEGGGRGGGSRGRSGTGRRRQPTEEQRQAMGFAGEWLALQYLRRRHAGFVDETCWVSRNRSRLYSGDEGDDAAGYDFCVKTPRAEWLYEVKSSLEDTGEFEMTPNEMRVAASMSRHGRRRYRVLYVPFVFSPDHWFVLELPNPMNDATRDRFRQVGQGSVRFRFEHSGGPHTVA